MDNVNAMSGGQVSGANGTDGQTTSVQTNGANGTSVQTNGAAMQNGNQMGQEVIKTYTQEDFNKALTAEADKRVNSALENARAKWEKEYNEKLQKEKDEAARLAKMSAEERENEEFNKRVKDFEEREAKYNRERLEFECTKQLASEKLPVEMSEMLTGSDAEKTKKNIETFKAVFSKAVENAVTERLKGATPPTKTKQDESDPFLQGFSGI